MRRKTGYALHTTGNSYPMCKTGNRSQMPETGRNSSVHVTGSSSSVSSTGSNSSQKARMINSWALVFVVYSILLVSDINVINAAVEKGQMAESPGSLFHDSYGIPELDESSNPVPELDDANFDKILEDFDTIFIHYDLENQDQKNTILQNLQVHASNLFACKTDHTVYIHFESIYCIWMVSLFDWQSIAKAGQSMANITLLLLLSGVYPLRPLQ